MTDKEIWNESCNKAIEELMKRIYSKDKSKVLKKALESGEPKISLWKGPDGVWHAANGPQHVPNWAVEVEHVR